jgi:hypothetical protein
MTALLETSQCCYNCLNANLGEDDANLELTGGKTLEVCSKYLRLKILLLVHYLSNIFWGTFRQYN